MFNSTIPSEQFSSEFLQKKNFCLKTIKWENIVGEQKSRSINKP